MAIVLSYDDLGRQVVDARTGIVTSGGGTPSGVLLPRRYLASTTNSI
jgi:hypothetical protein